MIMSREKRVIEKKDIMSLDVYTGKRREIRKNILDYKKIEELLWVLMLLFILKVMKQC